MEVGSEEEKWEKLDAEFDHFVVDMKPYVLKLPHRTERQRCALWIRKLCEPSGTGAGIMGRKNRNLYAKLLLHMLKRGVLEGPFTHRPEPGTLKILPSYMSIYFDEPNPAQAKGSSPEGLPAWVLGELETSERKLNESWKLSSGEDNTLVQSPTDVYSREQYTGKLRMRSHSMSPTHREDGQNITPKICEVYSKKSPVSLDDSDIEARLNSWNLGIENPRYLRQKPIPVSLQMTPKFSLRKSSSFHDDHFLSRIREKELDMKTKMMEAKFHEEKLRLQQKHDADVQKILERKNNEIEELKTLYRSKQHETEETIRKLEKKVQTLIRDCQVIRETKEDQIAELKKICEQSTESLNNDWEKKLHNAVAEMEQEKFDLQKRHTENIQELLEDTNVRLNKMESEYMAQTQSTNHMIKELEARVQQLTGEAENSNLQRQKLIQEKAELERCYQITCSELQEVKARRNTLHKEKDHLVNDYEQNMKLLQTKYDADINLLKQEHALSASKASSMIEELEQNVCQLKQQLQESELQRKQQLRDQENKFQMEKSHLKHTYEKKAHDLQSELDKGKEDTQKKIHKFEEALKEKEEQLTRVTEVQRLQAQQADAALEEFKRQVELNSEKVYAEMKEQMEKVEADLTRSKSLREKQSKEFLWQLEDIRQRYEQQIVELKLEHEQEKTHLLQQHNAEKDSLVRDHEREIENLEKQLRAANMEHEDQIQEFKKRDAQVIADMEAQVQKLREELINVNSQRKQQLVELGLLREEEKQRATREHEIVVNKLKAESEKMKIELKKTHAAETEMTLEKANSRLKQIEKEYTQKLAKSSQIIAELQTTISSLKEENSQQQLAAERRLQDVRQKFEDEKKQLIRDNDQAIKILQDELENRSNQVRCAEKKLQHKELESQEQITYIRQEYETKLKGLMPASLRQELEDTISSLKSQVNFLQKRASILQEELTTYQGRR
ncbi:centrosomal protein of 112 kDa isoform X4 [Papio anubis]|uniref:Centrosomal protein of 112 kDa isoform a n=8 Tax=Cercopithecinae TaxID=9528 RepID=H9FR06_MACMU|nr:centrosomal protein of 112 kDa isoform X1 [Macaca nemestrina]XP_014975634.2 centrosomal protein of 112 kDa isoform X1 [Macaca mulatta]XP_015294213.1 PREDICTED: centrosomal protein of 112 kDa isoform X1 [Macaca fascicularis]XP_024644652.1 centrosomal protein of 112 kDa isoform X1 [Macaca nemestrina]XP_028692514.1 centrosomal protein of 112 kDa isoform X1 [Macaca mulatta]XP_031513566.1 centrosomal protein of 112 kDa isoform X4 [Papio anubis]XP_031513567.1 centrosomal protein of 112 kDa isofo